MVTTGICDYWLHTGWILDEALNLGIVCSQQLHGNLGPCIQHAVRHAVQVSQGRALPSNTTIIAPNPALLSPPPQVASSVLGPGPSGALTLGVRRAIAAACEKVRGGAVPLHHSPHRSKPAPPIQLPSPRSQTQQCRSGQLPRLLQEQVWAKLPLSSPCPSRDSSLRCL